ncbi:hypothetical protein LY78DRAFT_60194 [Colletotrichum sublineola]|nr:hypothetical protein LY78DRAFT_60194 [Colletotrichum sublineola]
MFGLRVRCGIRRAWDGKSKRLDLAERLLMFRCRVFHRFFASASGCKRAGKSVGDLPSPALVNDELPSNCM